MLMLIWSPEDVNVIMDKSIKESLIKEVIRGLKSSKAIQGLVPPNI